MKVEEEVEMKEADKKACPHCGLYYTPLLPANGTEDDRQPTPFLCCATNTGIQGLKKAGAAIGLRPSRLRKYVTSGE